MKIKTKPEITYQKLRGGYYTPTTIAHFLAKWAIYDVSDRILEPSCGDGNLLETSVKRFIELGTPIENIFKQITAVEIDKQEAYKAAQRVESLVKTSAKFQIYNQDFFNFCENQLKSEQRYDVVIGNPPFIRYQNFPTDYRTTAFSLMQHAGLHPNRLTNSWVPFVVAATLLLNDTGRLAMVIPAELLQVKYAAELRYFLTTHYKSITLVSFKKLLFENVQQEVILLLATKKEGSITGVQAIEADGLTDIEFWDKNNVTIKSFKKMYKSTEKWTMYFLEEAEIELLHNLRGHLGLTIAREVLDVDVGIVTGLNDFFVINQQRAQDYDMESYLLPIVGRSAQLPGILFSKNDWQNLVKNQLPSYLLSPPNIPFEDLPEGLRNYVSLGENQGLNQGYKCRIRNRWYIVPSIWTPDAFMLRQIHLYPKLIINQANATCTDTIHRVRVKHNYPIHYLAAAFLNSLTFAFCEVSGRSYGGGVLELEPNEAETLPLPLKGAERLDVEKINELSRKGSISAILDITDQVLLEDGLGLSKQEVRMLRNIWEKLRNRRINRKLDTTKKLLASA